MRTTCRYLPVMALVWLGWGSCALAREPVDIGIIIDDMGNVLAEGLRAIELPGPVTYAFLPHTPYAARLARLAHMLDKEVMVHLPMESRSGNRLGPGGITRNMRGDALAAVLAGDIAAVPNVAGVSNHMGSLITPQRAVMGRVMDALSRHRGLYFVDSHTVADSVALAVAREHGIPAMKRDVFLDHDRAPGAIRGQFRRLIRLALDRGRAIGIGHPYRETIEVLDEVLRNLDQQAVRVIRVSTLLSRDPDPDPDRGSRPAAPSETALGAQSANFGEDLEVEFRANVGAGLGQ